MDGINENRKRRRDPPLDTQDATKRSRQNQTNTTTTNYLGGAPESYSLNEAYRYSIHEALPTVASSYPSFASAQRDATMAVDEILRSISTSTLDNEVFTGLVKELIRNRELAFTDEFKTAVVGEAGSGKSTFVNALLGYENLAETGASGFSCTQVVTEYVYSAEYDSSATIFFKGIEEIQQEVRDKITDWLRCHPSGRFKTSVTAEKQLMLREQGDTDNESASLADSAAVYSSEYEDHDEKEDSDGDDEDEDDKAKSSKAERYKTAEEYLMQVFGADSPFADEATLTETLRRMTPQQRLAFIAELEAVVDMVLRDIDQSSENAITISPGSIQGLTPHLDRYGCPQPLGRQGYWPLVRLIRVYLDSPLLQQGLVVADCPGVTDTHIMRRRAAQIYLQDCHIMIVVAVIDRVADNITVQSLLGRYIPQFGLQNVMLLLSKCDEIKENPKGRLYSSTPDTTKLQMHQQMLNDIHKKVTAARKASSPGLKLLLKEKKRAEWTLHRQRIIVRNNAIVKEMHRKHAVSIYRQVLADELIVIPISAEIHAKYVSGHADKKQCLDPTEDGIAKVRSALCSIARGDRVRLLKRHIVSDLPSSIHRVGLAVDQSPRDRAQATLSDIAQYANDLDHFVHNVWDGLPLVLKKDFLVPLDRNMTLVDGAWAKAISLLIQDWRHRYSNGSTCRAFAAKYGNHNPSGGPLVQWNELIKTVINRDIGAQKPILVKIFEPIKEMLHTKGEALIKSVAHDVKLNPDITEAYDMRGFFANMTIYRKGLASDIDAFFEGLIGRMHDAAKVVLSVRTDTGFSRGMNRVYVEMLDDTLVPKARGRLTIARYNHLEDSVTARDGESPVMRLLPEFEDSVDAIFRGAYDDLIDVVRGPLNKAAHDLQIKFMGHEAATKQEVLEGARLKRQLATSMPAAMALLDSAKQWLDEAVEMEKRAREADKARDTDPASVNHGTRGNDSQLVLARAQGRIMDGATEAHGMRSMVKSEPGK